MKYLIPMLLAGIMWLCACSKNGTYKASVADTLGYSANDTFDTCAGVFIKFEPVGKDKHLKITPTISNLPSFLVANFRPASGVPPFTAWLLLGAANTKVSLRGIYDLTITSDAQTQPCIIHYDYEPLQMTIAQRNYKAEDVYSDGSTNTYEFRISGPGDTVGAYYVDPIGWASLGYNLAIDAKSNNFHFTYPPVGGGTFYDDSVVVKYYDVARKDTVHSVWRFEH